MSNIRDTIANETEIRKLKSDLKYFINDAEMWTQATMELQQKLDEIEKLVDDGFFNEAIRDDVGNFMENDEDKTNKLKEILKGKQ